ncbi:MULTISPECIES: phage tail tape measure protein [Pasteurellaceae]|uniref:Phage tail tape measure protein n=1 Tax=Pasteurella atlantica TaxID=2827233 RepID=A0AAW8CRN6_9PAST|nr:phage tail tape measure protein [Pasteurella atlantica]MBR0574069.1 phage tail tape measure protein [Pasteurella atlantica]MDP8040108.1 phage tail tape measure protein [Pasteurella atlantica]MDP8042221.1 phage tail tape measure protein [Pasteurella atlantica]MDP8044372.1 phage tail tape measure protein [Pasteurella atlantica]MDP8046380.1 phage tail tape measure protein [Pasteurella atlantica]
MANDMKVQLELSVKDNASKRLKKVAQEAEKSFQNTEDAAVKSGKEQVKTEEKVAKKVEETQHIKELASQRALRTAQKISRSREQLGVRSERSVQREIRRSQMSYERLKRSGLASANELKRAFAAHKQQIKSLNAEMGKMSFGDRTRGIGRGAMAVGTGITAGAMVMREPSRNQMSFERRLAMVSNTAFSERGVEGRIAGKKELFNAVENAVNIGGGSKEDALASLDTLLASGSVDAKTAMDLLPTLQKGAVATGASPEDLARIAISSMQQFNIDPKEIGRVLDMAVAAGQAGNFELADMARWLPQQMAAAKNAGLTGMDGLQTLLVANQQARVTAGTSDEAGNNLVNLLAKITSKETNERFKNLKYKDPKTGEEKGIDFLASMEKYKSKGMNSLEAFGAIMEDVIGNDDKYKALKEKLKTAKGKEQEELLNQMTNLVEGSAVGKIISDRQALMAFLGIRNNVNLGKNVEKKVQNSDGDVDVSHKVIADTNDAKVKKLQNTADFTQMKNFEKVNNILGDLSETLADYGKEYPELSKYIIGTKDAVITFGAALAGFSLMSMAGGKNPVVTGNIVKSLVPTSIASKFAPSVIQKVAPSVASNVARGIATGASTLSNFALFGYAAAEGKIPYDARREAEEEKRAEAKKAFQQSYAKSSQVKHSLGFQAAPYAPIKSSGINYHGGYSISALQHNSEVAKERLKQGTLSQDDYDKRILKNEQQIRSIVRPQNNMSEMPDYHNYIQGLTQTISDGFKAINNQTHTIKNFITLEMDGRVITEITSTKLYNMDKRMGVS